MLTTKSKKNINALSKIFTNSSEKTFSNQQNKLSPSTAIKIKKDILEDGDNM